MATFSMDNPLLATYVFYASVLVLKMIFMSLWTAKQRITKKVFPAPEDYAGHGQKPKPLGFADEDVERVRRAHLNDLENILPFLIAGFLFVLTDPNIVVAKWIFRVFTAARIVYTLGYLNGIHALRSVGFLPSLFCNIMMTGMVVKSAFGNF